MSKVYRARARPLVVAALVAVGALASAGSASAQTVLFTGATYGCFGAGCVPTVGPSSFLGLSYTGAPAFSALTNNGFAGIGGSSLADSFGSFSLTSAGASYTGQTFNLLIAFTNPEDVDNPFAATLTGTVEVAGNGIFIDFLNNNPVALGGTSALYQVSVNDLSVTAGSPSAAYVTGNVWAQSTVPEPISLVLLGSGLFGLAAARRRRTKVDQDDVI